MVIWILLIPVSFCSNGHTTTNILLDKKIHFSHVDFASKSVQHHDTQIDPKTAIEYFVALGALNQCFGAMVDNVPWCFGAMIDNVPCVAKCGWTCGAPVRPQGPTRH